MNKKTLIFLAGLFAMTEVYIGGFIAISELVIFIVAPYVFLVDYKLLKRDGFLPLLWLLMLAMAGCVIATRANGTPFPSFAKGFAAIYATWGSLICMHRLLRDDFMRVKWFFLGYAFSLVLNIFAFQRGSARHLGDVAIVSGAAMESTMNSVIFWAGRLPHWIYLPLRGWFASTPAIYSRTAPLVLAGISLFSSGGSGRAAALCALATFAVLLVEGRSRVSLKQHKQRIIILCVLLVLIGVVAKKGYESLAQSGVLGEYAVKKYENQTRLGNSAIDMLVAGRSEFFVGLYCAVKKPIIGYGPWPVDKDGDVGLFLSKYGTYEDYEVYLRSQRDAYAMGMKQALLPTHSCIMGWWVWYGILGLSVWVYILWLYWKTITAYCVCYPPWFGCIATILPAAVWDAFFSPYGSRVMMGMFFAMCLYLKAVFNKRLPPGGVRW